MKCDLPRNRREGSDTALLDEWVDKYERLRAGGPGHVSAWLGIPLIVSALIGLLWSIPVPAVLSDASPVINAATLFLMATFVYYCILSISLAMAGLVFMLLTLAPYVLLAGSRLSLLPIVAGLFVVCLAWQLAQTKRATGRVRLARNLQYLMLGPLWLLRAVFRKFRLDY